MKSNTPPSELSLALDTIRPAIVRAVVFSMIISLMMIMMTTTMMLMTTMMAIMMYVV